MFYDIINNIAEWIIAGLFPIECQRVDGDGVIFLVRVEITPKIKKNIVLFFRYGLNVNRVNGLGSKKYKFTEMKRDF